MALTQQEEDFIFAGLVKEEQTLEQKLEALRLLIQEHQQSRLEKDFPKLAGIERSEARIIPGKKYTKIDVKSGAGWSGKYMVENDTQTVYGIKGYGVIHRGHCFGTLDEMLLWDWSGYRAFKK